MFINSGHHEIRQNRLDVAVLYLVSSSSSSCKKWDGVKCLHTSNYAREEYSIEHMQCALRNSNNDICNVVIQYSFILSARCSSCNSSPALKRGLTLPPCGHQGHKVPKLSSLFLINTATKLSVWWMQETRWGYFCLLVSQLSWHCCITENGIFLPDPEEMRFPKSVFHVFRANVSPKTLLDETSCCLSWVIRLVYKACWCQIHGDRFRVQKTADVAMPSRESEKEMSSCCENTPFRQG